MLTHIFHLVLAGGGAMSSKLFSLFPHFLDLHTFIGFSSLSFWCKQHSFICQIDRSALSIQSPGILVRLGSSKDIESLLVCYIRDKLCHETAHIDIKRTSYSNRTYKIERSIKENVFSNNIIISNPIFKEQKELL